MPGLHTIYLSQFEENFKFSHILLTPKRLLTWAPLGIQSRYIPDSHFKAFPPSSFPAPKYGRLNGIGKNTKKYLVDISYDVFIGIVEGYLHCILFVDLGISRFNF